MTGEKYFFSIRLRKARREIKYFDGSMTTPIDDISVNILKSTIDISFSIRTNINISIEKRFPRKSKFAKVTPIF